MILSVLVILGCSKSNPGTSTDKSTKKPETPDTPQVLESLGGTTTCRGKGNEKIWDLAWKAGAISIDPNQKRKFKDGNMSDVSGKIYRNGAVACTFKSKYGAADQSTKILTLTEQVEVVSSSPQATLTCDKLVYDGVGKFFKATGHVQISGTMGKVGTLEEVWATPQLDKVATPDDFNKP